MSFAKLVAKGPKLDFVPVRTVNEETKGWQLAKRDPKETKKPKSGILAYFLLTSTMGIVVSYFAVSKWGHEWPALLQR